MTLKAISIDDEPRAHIVIKHYSAKIDHLELVESFTSPLKAANFIRENPVDLLFLDINMPDMNGISFLNSLKNPHAVIFTTAYDEYAVESYDHEAAGYLLKPIEFPKFYKAVMRVLDSQRTSQKESVENMPGSSPSLLLKSGTKLLKFKSHEIYFIEASGNYTEIILRTDNDSENSTRVLVDHSLIDLMDEYLPASFIRIHRSYVINADHLQSYESHQVKIRDTLLPIGKTYRKSVQSIITG